MVIMNGIGRLRISNMFRMVKRLFCVEAGIIYKVSSKRVLDARR